MADDNPWQQTLDDAKQYNPPPSKSPDDDQTPWQETLKAASVQPERYPTTVEWGKPIVEEPGEEFSDTMHRAAIAGRKLQPQPAPTLRPDPQSPPLVPRPVPAELRGEADGLWPAIKGVARGLYQVSTPGIAASLLEENAPNFARRLPTIMRRYAAPANRLPGQIAATALPMMFGDEVPATGLRNFGEPVPKMTEYAPRADAPTTDTFDFTGEQRVPSTNEIRDTIQRDARQPKPGTAEDKLDDRALQQDMRGDLERHGMAADEESRRRFAAGNTTGTTKGELVKKAQRK
jgi:hypothetical protein